MACYNARLCVIKYALPFNRVAIIFESCSYDPGEPVQRVIWVTKEY
jgi:hypothetical protein